jgi:hypothetical protein
LPLQLQSEALKTYIDDLRKLQSAQQKAQWSVYQVI